MASVARQPLDALFDEAREILQRGPCFVTFGAARTIWPCRLAVGPVRDHGRRPSSHGRGAPERLPGGATFAGLMEPSELGRGSSYHV
jgi:hypothetical protein